MHSMRVIKLIHTKLNSRKLQMIAIVALFLMLLVGGCSGTADIEQTDGKDDISNSQIETNVQEDNNPSEKEETRSGENEEQNEQKKAEEVTTSNPPLNSLKVHYIDVGQADSILIQNGANAMLIDAGNNGDSNLVVNYLKQQGVSKLDYVVGTHPHEDHIGGLDVVINSFNIEKVIMPKTSHTTKTFEDVLIAIKNKGLKIISPTPGTDFKFGDTTFKILANNNGSDLNNTSTVIKLTHGSNTFLFQGDAEGEVEHQILNQGFNVKADVIKLGHHGSNTSSTKIYLDAASPKYAIISAGKDNSYGHPHRETLGKLKSAGIKAYRTDEQGTIVATSDGDSITFNQKEVSLNVSSTVPKEPSNSASNSNSNSTASNGAKTSGSNSLIISSISLDKDTVIIKNPTSKEVDMTGWRLVSVEGNQTFDFPNGYVLNAGETVEIVSGREAEGNGDSVLKWSGRYIWNNDGDPGQLYDNNGNLVSSK